MFASTTPIRSGTLRRPPVQRALVTCVAICLCTSCAPTADARTESALREFRAVGTDPRRLEIFCAMGKVLDTVDEKDDAAAEAAIASYLKELGPEFEKAWKIGEDVDENSPDGKALTSAIDELAGMCD